MKNIFAVAVENHGHIYGDKDQNTKQIIGFVEEEIDEKGLQKSLKVHHKYQACLIDTIYRDDKSQGRDDFEIEVEE